MNQLESHLQVEPSFVPDATGDGLTFKLGTAFLSNVPATSSRLTGWTGLPVGSAIGHSNTGPILINRVCGPVEMLSPDTFRIAFDRVGTNNIYGQTRSRDIVLTAVHGGDSTYVRAVQQAQVRIPLPLTSGAAQAISFTQPANQLNGTTNIPLTASTTGTATYAGATVDFYVREGPAKVSGNTLTFTTLPPRTKFPVKVTVVATQYGRTIAPLLQTATPVTRTMWIHQNALEQWRYQTFGTLATGSNGELQWTLSANSSDSADFDNDGLTNLQEYNATTDPKVAQTAIEVWRVQNFGSAANSGSSSNTADDDNDSVPNLMEFAFGMNTGASDNTEFTLSGNTLTSHGMPGVNVDTQPFTVNYTARFVRRKTHATESLIYTPQFSADLSTWEDNTAVPVVVGSDATHDVVEVPYPLFIGGKKARFFRLSVSTLP